MKKYLLLFVGVIAAKAGFSQNSLPTTGNVGIGTSTPIEQLEVIGTSLFNGEIKVGNNPIGSEGYGRVKASNSSFSMGWKKDGSQHYGSQLQFSKDGYVSVISTNGTVGLKVQNSTDGTKYINHSMDVNGNYFMGPAGSGSTPSLYIKDGGYIGIGTSNPTQKLEVAGSLKADGMQLQQKFVWKLRGTSQGVLAPVSAGYNDYSFMMSDAGSTVIGTQNAQAITLKTDGQNRVRVLGDGKMGIGTITPSEMLEVAGNIKTQGLILADGSEGAGRILMSNGNGVASWNDASVLAGPWTIDQGDIAFNSGFVGIGISDPEAALDIIGDVNIRGAAGEDVDFQLFLDGPGDLGTRKGLDLYLREATGNALLQTTEPSQNLVLGGGDWDESMMIRDGGQVVIGDLRTTGLPSEPVNEYRLIVNGKIGASNIRVDAAKWGDYVFEEAYELNSLEEVKNYTQQNKHLPGIPSAQELDETGIDMAEMLNMQMVKIEELTLYLIELNEKVKNVEGENVALKSLLDK